MSSTAAAGILGIEDIAKYSESVKKVITALEEFYVYCCYDLAHGV